MKAVILAGGKGTRLLPLTENTPKPMVLVSGKPILERILNELPDQVLEVFIIVGYLADQIKDYFGDSYNGKNITYIQQDQLLGTAHALGLCRSYIKPGEKFFYLVGDDLHKKSALTKLAEHDLAVLVKEHPEPHRFGVIEIDESGAVKSIEEKPKNPKSNFVSTGVYVLDEKVFHYPAKLEEVGEYYITDQVQKMMRDYPLKAEVTDFWHPISSPKDITLAEELLKKYYA